MYPVTIFIRAILGSKGEDSKTRIRHSTRDLKPQMHEERERIRKAGGYVQNGRVNGSLAVSRKVSFSEIEKKAWVSR